jgi:hypothetical protein
VLFGFKPCARKRLGCKIGFPPAAGTLTTAFAVLLSSIVLELIHDGCRMLNMN